MANYDFYIAENVTIGNQRFCNSQGYKKRNNRNKSNQDHNTLRNELDKPSPQHQQKRYKKGGQQHHQQQQPPHFVDLMDSELEEPPDGGDYREEYYGNNEEFDQGYQEYASHNHEEHHHGSDFSSPTSTFCHPCSTSFRTPERLVSHLRKSDKHNPFNLCLDCNTPFSPNHTHSCLPPKIFICELCISRFPSEDAFRGHIYFPFHQVNKFRCDVCQMDFDTGDDRRKHMRKNKCQSPDVSFCNTCGGKYSIYREEAHRLGCVKLDAMEGRKSGKKQNKNKKGQRKNLIKEERYWNDIKHNRRVETEQLGKTGVARVFTLGPRPPVKPPRQKKLEAQARAMAQHQQQYQQQYGNAPLQYQQQGGSVPQQRQQPVSARTCYYSIPGGEGSVVQDLKSGGDGFSVEMMEHERRYAMTGSDSKESTRGGDGYVQKLTPGNHEAMEASTTAEKSSEEGEGLVGTAPVKTEVKILHTSKWANELPSPSLVIFEKPPTCKVPHMEKGFGMQVAGEKNAAKPVTKLTSPNVIENIAHKVKYNVEIEEALDNDQLPVKKPYRAEVLIGSGSELQEETCELEVGYTTTFSATSTSGSGVSLADASADVHASTPSPGLFAGLYKAAKERKKMEQSTDADDVDSFNDFLDRICA